MPEPPVLRLIDANANRAREALRVLEDYARFVLNSPQHSAALKSVRHDLASALAPTLAEAVAFRDTPHDVGVALKTAAEQQRTDLAHVVTAATKRLAEALRSLEEYLKISDPPAAAAVEQLRYRCYTIEQQLAATLRPATRIRHVRLYVLITEKLCSGRPWLATAEAALRGGAECLQLREKELNGSELLRRARQLVELCRAHDALCIINDRADIALLASADGVHVGQDDLPPTEARKIVGNRAIVGVSTHNIAQARQAVLDGADYLGVGPFFPSATKPRDFLPGPAYAREAAAEIHIPLVAIAGITSENVSQVIATGIRTVAVTAAVTSNPDPRAAAEQLKQRLSRKD